MWTEGKRWKYDGSKNRIERDWYRQQENENEKREYKTEREKERWMMWTGRKRKGMSNREESGRQKEKWKTWNIKKEKGNEKEMKI